MGSNMEGNWQLLPHPEAEKPIAVYQGSTTYKRTFPFDLGSGQLVISRPTISEEQELVQQSHQYAGIKLLRGLWQEQLLGAQVDSSGTHFPVAAPLGETLWCSAGHCLISTKQQWWRCGYGQEVMKTSPSSEQAFRTVIDLTWLRDGSILSEVMPSDPSRSIPAAAVLPDFGFLQTTGPACHPDMLFIPCSDPLTTGKPVCLLGFAAKPSADWARCYLRTEADFEAYKVNSQGKDPPLDWELEDRMAFQRTLNLLDEVYFPNKLVAAPGKVAAATVRMVEHTCSSFPGMSGSPGVDIRMPWKLLFVHTGAPSDFRRNVNYGYSVNHPLFVKAYVREILPKLLTTPPTLFKPDMVTCLFQYLTIHKDQLDCDPGHLMRAAKLM